MPILPFATRWSLLKSLLRIYERISKLRQIERDISIDINIVPLESLNSSSIAKGGSFVARNYREKE